MLHLHTERLAELGDDTPTAEEAAHLAACAVCAHERDAYEALVAMAHAEREPFGLPLTRWDTIAAELSSQNVLTLSVAEPPRRSNRWQMQIAAGLLLVAGGAMAGRVSAGAGPLPSNTSVAAIGSSTAQSMAARADADSTFFASVDDARATQQKSELLYQQAAAYLARYDSAASAVSSPVAIRTRLAALDRVLSTTRDAMRDAPHDPVINGYYLTTLGQREATLRQINTSMPSSLRVNSF